LDQVLHAPEGKVADEYKTLVDLLSKVRQEEARKTLIKEIRCLRCL
jgi:hypothetical protein